MITWLPHLNDQGKISVRIPNKKDSPLDHTALEGCLVKTKGSLSSFIAHSYIVTSDLYYLKWSKPRSELSPGFMYLYFFYAS